MIDLPAGFIDHFVRRTREKNISYGAYMNAVLIIAEKSSGLSNEASEILRRLKGYEPEVFEASRAAIARDLIEFEKLANSN
jgi:hypothetical protein